MTSLSLGSKIALGNYRRLGHFEIKVLLQHRQSTLLLVQSHVSTVGTQKKNESPHLSYRALASSILANELSCLEQVQHTTAPMRRHDNWLTYESVLRYSEHDFGSHPFCNTVEYFPHAAGAL